MELPHFTLDNLRQLPEDMMVFMCRQCRLPLGDSSNLCEMQDTTEVLILNAVSEHVYIKREKIISNYEDEKGCCYQVLQCKGCGTPIGKHFLSTPKPLDDQLERFLLNAVAVRVYSLGSACKQMVAPFDAPITLANCHDFEAEIKKCKTLLGTLQRKVESIESGLSS